MKTSLAFLQILVLWSFHFTHGQTIISMKTSLSDVCLPAVTSTQVNDTSYIVQDVVYLVTVAFNGCTDTYYNTITAGDSTYYTTERSTVTNNGSAAASSTGDESTTSVAACRQLASALAEATIVSILVSEPEQPYGTLPTAAPTPMHAGYGRPHYPNAAKKDRPFNQGSFDASRNNNNNDDTQSPSPALSHGKDLSPSQSQDLPAYTTPPSTLQDPTISPSISIQTKANGAPSIIGGSLLSASGAATVPPYPMNTTTPVSPGPSNALDLTNTTTFTNTTSLTNTTLGSSGRFYTSWYADETGHFYRYSAANASPFCSGEDQNAGLCFPGNFTIFYNCTDECFLSLDAPAGLVYVNPNGALRYSLPGQVSIADGSYPHGFSVLPSTSSTPGKLTFSSGNWLECSAPVVGGNATIWKLYANVEGFKTPRCGKGCACASIDLTIEGTCDTEGDCTPGPAVIG